MRVTLAAHDAHPYQFRAVYQRRLMALHITPADPVRSVIADARHDERMS